MYVARILYPIEVLGPGKRVGIWFCGCPHKCDGCSNPELWSQDEAKNISLETLLDLIRRIVEVNQVDGFTITGGEPFFQHEDLELLLRKLSEWSQDILVFSGYHKEQIEKFSTLKNVAVLIDGPYLKERNFGLALRGSDNQRIHILKPEFEKAYKAYLSADRSKIQNFLEGNSVISVGIHKPDFAERIKMRMAEKGLVEGGKK